MTDVINYADVEIILYWVSFEHLKAFQPLPLRGPCNWPDISLLSLVYSSNYCPAVFPTAGDGSTVSLVNLLTNQLYILSLENEKRRRRRQRKRRRQNQLD